MEFQEFPKIPRFNREIVITEKIDGTNAQILIHTFESYRNHFLVTSPIPPSMASSINAWVEEREKNEAISLRKEDGTDYILRAGSRNRWLTEEQDNFGFWKWVREHAEELVKLGPGRHYGEWWGHGIQRGYDLSEKRFSLFDTARWGPDNPNRPACCSVVPILSGPSPWSEVQGVLDRLRNEGSVAAPGFMKPEGIVIYHKASRNMFKVLLEHDEIPKTQIKAVG